MLQGKLKMMRRAREPLIKYLLLFAEVRKCLPLADTSLCMLCTSRLPGDSKLFDEVDGSGHEQVSFAAYPD